MRMLAFARRNMREMLRDPLTLFFGAGFPLVLLLLLSLIQANIPVPLFEANKLAPGIAVFGQFFLALFAALLVSRDRCSALMLRLRTSPMRGVDFILGYILPLIPLALAQGLLCLMAAVPLGLDFGWGLIRTLAALLPGALMNISLGLICGCLFNERQVGGVCGALLTNVGAWLSGTWFDLSLVGGAFERIAYMLPFANAVDAARAAFVGGDARMSLIVVCIYSIAFTLSAVWIFARRALES